MQEDGAKSHSSEVKKLRLVLCPNCHKLLPELTEFSIYKCGGCNTTLQAKHSASTMSSPSEKTDNERMLNSELTVIQNMKDGTQKDKDDFVEKEAALIKSLNGSPNSNTDLNERGEDPGRLLVKEEALLDSSLLDDQGKDRMEVGSKAFIPVGINQVFNDFRDKTDLRRGSRKKTPGVESRNVSRNKGDRHSNKIPFDDHASVKGKAKADAQLDVIERRHRDGIRDDNSRPRRIPRGSAHAIHAPSYLDDVCSRYQPSSRYDNFPDSVEHLEQDEADTLRKLDELRYWVSQLCKIKDAKDENPIPENKSVHPNNTYETFDTNGPFPRGAYLSNSHSFQPFPSMNERDMNTNSYHRMVPAHEEMFGYNDSQISLSFGRTPRQSPHMCMQQASVICEHKHSDPVPATSYSHKMFRNQPACSCTHFHKDLWHMPSHNSRTRGLYPKDSVKFRSNNSYTSKSINSFRLSHGPRRHHKPSFTVSTRHERQTIAGGAPYIVCRNCFEVLMLPHGILWKRDRGKLRCGECFWLITIMIDKNQLKIVESALTCQMTDGLKHQVPVNKSLDSTNREPSGKNINSAGNNDCTSMPAVTITNTITEKCHSLELSKTENREGMPSSQGTSIDGSPMVSLSPQDVDESEEIPQQNSDADPHIHDSTHSEHLYPSFNQGVIKYVFGNIDTLSEKDNIVHIDGNYRKIPTKDAPLVTELELPSNEHPTLDLSSESQDGVKKGEGSRMIKGDDPYIIGPENNDQLHLIKPVDVRYRVSINGHPISDRIVKKAEIKAGPIQSGDYWYDYAAGFWGIMGQPCLGIIPPSIEEFNFPMPKDCAGGNTGVMVNGRELHRRDLDLLVCRGLPSSKGRSYIVGISGRVQDAVSGGAVVTLGKLAPTVMKIGYGFGMRAPKR